MQRLTPLRAIRKYCVWCCADNPIEPRFCVVKNCSLYKFRLGQGRGRYLKGIRLRCLNCSAFVSDDVKDCQFQDCPLFYYRFGRSPHRKGKGGYTKIANYRIKSLHPL